MYAETTVVHLTGNVGGLVVLLTSQYTGIANYFAKSGVLHHVSSGPQRTILFLQGVIARSLT